MAVILPVGLTLYGLAAVAVPAVMMVNPAVVRERWTAAVTAIRASLSAAAAQFATVRSRIAGLRRAPRYRGGHRD